MPEQNDMMNRIRNLQKTPLKIDKNRQPPKCSQCLYYQPEFRYRKCLYAICPYGKNDKAVFRNKILPTEKIACKAVK